MTEGVAWVWSGFLWLLFKGYVIAYALGIMTVLMTNIVENSKQIRRNSEQIRRNSETIRRQVEAKLTGWNGPTED